MEAIMSSDLEKLTSIYKQLSDVGKLLTLNSANTLFAQQQMEAGKQQGDRSA